jgi:hypothetical protein
LQIEHLPTSIMNSPFSISGSSLSLNCYCLFLVTNALVAASIFPKVELWPTGTTDVFRVLIFMRSVYSVIDIAVFVSTHINCLKYLRVLLESTFMDSNFLRVSFATSFNARANVDVARSIPNRSISFLYSRILIKIALVCLRVNHE